MIKSGKPWNYAFSPIMVGNLNAIQIFSSHIWTQSRERVRNVSPWKIMENRFFVITFHSLKIWGLKFLSKCILVLWTHWYNYDFIRYSLRLNIDTFVTFCYKVAYFSQKFQFLKNFYFNVSGNVTQNSVMKRAVFY